MLDNLTDLVRQNAGEAVINNPSIPNEKNEQAVENARGSIMSTLQHALSGGRLNEVLGFFKKGSSGSPEIVQEATSNYAKDLQINLGLNEEEAKARTRAIAYYAIENGYVEKAKSLEIDGKHYNLDQTIFVNLINLSNQQIYRLKFTMDELK